jgi:hypothetical protein
MTNLKAQAVTNKQNMVSSRPQNEMADEASQRQAILNDYDPPAKVLYDRQGATKELN